MKCDPEKCTLECLCNECPAAKPKPPRDNGRRKLPPGMTPAVAKALGLR